jgi:hypothetical protein
MSRTWRLPALILIPLMVVAGLAIQARNDDAAVTDVRLSELTATAAAPGTPSSTWYCAAGSATGVASGEGAGPAEQRVIVANNSDEAARGTMTIFPEGAPPKGVAIEVAAHSRAAVVVSEQVKAPWAAALVEITGGEVTVAHELSGPTGRSVSNCASTPSADWYFPGGTTRVGTDMWIALFNPFPGEATVDIAFETEVGARTAQEYQGIVVPGGSVVVKKVSEKVTLHDHASATVTTRSGRIIAEQVQSFEGREGGAKGLTATVGATTPAPIWAFPMGAPGGVTAGEAVSVFNPGDSDTDVLVQVQLDDPAVNGTVEPFEVTIPAHRYAVVDISGDQRVPPGVAHWVVVRTPDGSDVVAERTLTGVGPNGVSYSIGLPVVATRWLVTVAATSDTATSQLSIVNPSATDAATVSVRRQGGGSVAEVAGATGGAHRDRPPGRRLRGRLDGRGRLRHRGRGRPVDGVHRGEGHRDAARRAGGRYPVRAGGRGRPDRGHRSVGHRRRRDVAAGPRPERLRIPGGGRRVLHHDDRRRHHHDDQGRDHDDQGRDHDDQGRVAEVERVVLALVLVVVAVVVAVVFQRRKPAPPAGPSWNVPVQLDRADFARPEAPWLVVVFTSATCEACGGVWEKAVPLDAGPAGPVVVQQVEVTAAPELHRRYGIDAVPLVLVADEAGIVRTHFLGPVTATDLWAAVAEAREPGSTPQHCQNHGDESGAEPTTPA